jgi:hypothetical protein
MKITSPKAEKNLSKNGSAIPRGKRHEITPDKQPRQLHMVQPLLLRRKLPKTPRVAQPSLLRMNRLTRDRQCTRRQPVTELSCTGRRARGQLSKLKQVTLSIHSTRQMAKSNLRKSQRHRAQARSDLAIVETENGSVTCSQNHHFHVSGRSWTPASELQKSDQLTRFTRSNPDPKIAAAAFFTSRKDLAAAVPVYNLSVEHNHNYFVGPDAILCHNSKGM